jgi:hypothetical protein
MNTSFTLPDSVQDVIDDNATFEPAVLAAVKTLRRSHAWQGTPEERLAKQQACCDAILAAYGLEPVTLALRGHRVYKWDAEKRVLQLGEHLSVVTFLHAMAAVRGANAFGRFRWSINLFRRVFPRSFERCEQIGPYLVRR